jgi:hypothetical protein
MSEEPVRRRVTFAEGPNGGLSSEEARKCHLTCTYTAVCERTQHP